MKKTILVFIAILVGIYLVVSVWDYKSGYSSEVYLFKANKLLARIVQNPESIPPSLYEKTARAYKKVINKFPQSRNAKRAILFLGNLDIVSSKFDQARSQLNKFKEQYNDDKNLVAEIEFLIGNSFEKQGQWVKAERIYNNVLRDYPDSLKSIQIPLYIARHFQATSDSREATLAYGQAIAYYQKQAKENPDSLKGYAALSSVATCYIDQKNWTQALDALTVLIEEYPKSRELPNFFQMISLISLGQLKDAAKAIEIYEGFIQKYPKHPLAGTLKNQIKKLKNVKLK